MQGTLHRVACWLAGWLAARCTPPRRMYTCTLGAVLLGQWDYVYRDYSYNNIPDDEYYTITLPMQNYDDHTKI